MRARMEEIYRGMIKRGHPMCFTFINGIEVEPECDRESPNDVQSL